MIQPILYLTVVFSSRLEISTIIDTRSNIDLCDLPINGDPRGPFFAITEVLVLRCHTKLEKFGELRFWMQLGETQG